MINARSCDICRAALAAEVTRLELVRGAVIFLPRDRWSVEPVPAGMRVRMICTPCDLYMREAVQHLLALVSPSITAAAQAARPSEDASQHAVA